MCLSDTLLPDTKKFNVSKQKIEKRGYGWKVFYRRYNGNLMTPIYTNSTNIKVGVWQKETSKFLPGFHVFTSKRGAKSYSKYFNPANHVLLKVLIKNVRSIGEENGNKAFTCQQYKIVPNQ